MSHWSPRPFLLFLAILQSCHAFSQPLNGYTQLTDLNGASRYSLTGAADNVWKYDTYGLFSETVFGWCAETCEGLQRVVLKRVDDRPFNLYQIDAAVLYIDPPNGEVAADGVPILVKGFWEDGATRIQTLTLPDTANQFATHTLNGFDSVIRIEFSKEDPSSDYFDGALKGLVFCAPGQDKDGDQFCDAQDDFPEDASENTDTDGDGLGDNQEWSIGTDVNEPDTDDDGETDYAEVQQGTDPLDENDPLVRSSGLSIWLLKAVLDAKSNEQ